MTFFWTRIFQWVKCDGIFQIRRIEINNIINAPRWNIIQHFFSRSSVRINKSNSMTILDILNTPDVNISTIEDPIEYFHNHKKSILTQREIGVDVPSFKEALRRALRQDPDIVLVGEMRDADTVETGLRAAMRSANSLATAAGSSRRQRQPHPAPSSTNQHGIVKLRLRWSQMSPKVAGTTSAPVPDSARRADEMASSPHAKILSASPRALP